MGGPVRFFLAFLSFNLLSFWAYSSQISGKDLAKQIAAKYSEFNTREELVNYVIKNSNGALAPLFDAVDKATLKQRLPKMVFENGVLYIKNPEHPLEFTVPSTDPLILVINQKSFEIDRSMDLLPQFQRIEDALSQKQGSLQSLFLPEAQAKFFDNPLAYGLGLFAVTAYKKLGGFWKTFTTGHVYDNNLCVQAWTGLKESISKLGATAEGLTCEGSGGKGSVTLKSGDQSFAYDYGDKGIASATSYQFKILNSDNYSVYFHRNSRNLGYWAVKKNETEILRNGFNNYASRYSKFTETVNKSSLPAATKAQALKAQDLMRQLDQYHTESKFEFSDWCKNCQDFDQVKTEILRTAPSSQPATGQPAADGT